MKNLLFKKKEFPQSKYLFSNSFYFQILKVEYFNSFSPYLYSLLSKFIMTQNTLFSIISMN